MQVTELLSEDHRAVNELLVHIERAEDEESRRVLVERLADELEVHARLEEEIFYPAARAVSRRIDDAEAAHAHVRALVERVRDPAGAADARLRRQLKQAVLAHAAEEEAGIFLDAGRLGREALEQLGRQAAERRRELTGGVRRAA